jgi:hypothetical protein
MFEHIKSYDNYILYVHGCKGNIVHMKKDNERYKFREINTMCEMINAIALMQHVRY